MMLAGLQSKSQSLLKESVKEDEKNFMKFQTGVSKFQFKVSFSTSKFPIRVSKLRGGRARLNCFDCKCFAQQTFAILFSNLESFRSHP